MMVLWFRSQSKLSRLIRWVTRSPYSHVGIWVNNVLYEALGTGITRLDIPAVNPRLQEAIAFKHLDSDPEDIKQMQAWLDGQVGHGYSTLGFIAAGISTLTGYKYVISIKGEYICSGLVATALQIAGYLLQRDVDARLETPASLAVRLQPIPFSGREMPETAMVEQAAAQRKGFLIGG
jgi:hypothetical protein